MASRVINSTIIAFFCLLLLVVKNVAADGSFTYVVNESTTVSLEKKIKRSDFPSDFYFGAATSAAQIEGSANEGGRGPSVWDHRVKILPSSIINSENFSTAVDGYKRYKEDVQLLKNLGVNSYRFSISWSRILPTGSLNGGINQVGIDYYNRLINELIKNGITPFVTLHHFDLPQVLEDKYGGFLSRLLVNDFKDYAELCFKTFGDRVKHWFTFNEPRNVASFAYEVGVMPPGRCSLPNNTCAFPSSVPGKCNAFAGPCIFGGNSSTEPYIVTHNIVLAHATVVKLYREKYQTQQKGEIGFALSSQYYVPYSESKEDKAAANRLLEFNVGWYVEPFLFGDYPKSMRDLVKERLPTFSAKEKELMKGNLGDFVGMNYYTSAFAKHNPPPPTKKLRYSLDAQAQEIAIRDGDLPGALNNQWPEGLQMLMLYIKNKYQNPKIIISENGIPDRRNDTLPLAVQLNDVDRISYLVRHLYHLNWAIKKGANVAGYLHWSLLDNFEWSFGYSMRFGLYYTDYNNNYKRIPKLSIKWYRGFLQGNETKA